MSLVICMTTSPGICPYDKCIGVTHALQAYPNNFDSALVSLVVGLSALKGRQKAVVNVDCVVCMPCTEILAEDLHVPEVDRNIVYPAEAVPWAVIRRVAITGSSGYEQAKLDSNTARRQTNKTYHIPLGSLVDQLLHTLWHGSSCSYTRMQTNQHSKLSLLTYSFFYMTRSWYKANQSSNWMWMCS